MIKSHIVRMLTFIRLRLSCCTILVVGCNHGIQYREHLLFDSPQQRVREETREIVPTLTAPTQSVAYS